MILGDAWVKIEQGKVDIYASRLKQISETFGMTLADLFRLNEKNVFNFIENFHSFILHSQRYKNSTTDPAICKHELEKAYLIIEQKEKEIAYLKEIIELMKKQT